MLQGAVESNHPLGVIKINAHEEFSPPKLDLDKP